MSPQNNVADELTLTSLAMSRMSCLPDFNGFRYEREVSVLLLFFRMLFPGFVQYGLQHSCAIALQLSSQCALTASTWCIHIIVWTRLQLENVFNSSIVGVSFTFIVSFTVSLNKFWCRIETFVSTEFCSVFIFLNMLDLPSSVSCRIASTVSLTLSRHPSLLPIAPGRSSKQHPVSAQSCCILVLASRPTFARS